MPASTWGSPPHAWPVLIGIPNPLIGLRLRRALFTYSFCNLEVYPNAAYSHLGIILRPLACIEVLGSPADTCTHLRSAVWVTKN